MVPPGLGAPLLLIIMLAMVVLPLPPFALDVLVHQHALSLVVLLATIYSERPLISPFFPPCC